MSIYIEKGKSQELYVSFTYSYERVKRIKEIKGSRWNPALKHWVLPDTGETLKKLVLAFQDEELIPDGAIDFSDYI